MNAAGEAAIRRDIWGGKKIYWSWVALGLPGHADPCDIEDGEEDATAEEQRLALEVAIYLLSTDETWRP